MFVLSLETCHDVQLIFDVAHLIIYQMIHIIGLPIKGRIEKPIFDYEKILYDSLLDLHNDYSNALTLNHTFKQKHII
jgi:hypothetical protein